MKEYSAIPEAELNNSLVYLCNPKQKILDKENMKKPQFVSTEKVSVNEGFSNNNLRVNFVPTQTHKKKTTEKTETEKVDDKEIRIERQNIIDAVIVRIMKVIILFLFINFLYRQERLRSTTSFWKMLWDRSQSSCLNHRWSSRELNLLLKESISREMMLTEANTSTCHEHVHANVLTFNYY